MKHSILILFFSVSFGVFAQMPVSDPNGGWKLLTDYSDEFNSTLDLTKWDININDWSVWSWEPEHVWLADGNMHIRMINEQHVRGTSTYYFKSGAARQKKTITFGYFEAKVKGCPTFPGVCPAFWMYSSNKSLNGVTYNEIDFMEIQQRQLNISGIDCNTHYVLSGSSAWIDTKNYYNAPFKPNEGFHTYGCNVTPTEITFYIDGVKVATNANKYFILPMNVILSMGVRPPLMEYGTNGEKLPIVVLNNPGFPTEMLVDYVRVWQPISTETTQKKDSESTKLTNYPNPFSNSTTIEYTIAKKGDVNLTLFDTKGRKIKVLVNESKIPGTYTSTITKKEIGGNGIYICKLNVDGQITTTKLSLVK